MKRKFLPKLLEAMGLACVMVGFVQGVYGDMWGELYLPIGGIFIFVIGRHIEKRIEKAAASVEGTG
ncbi:MAG: hypothetical protein E6K56_06935 [Ignavibacteria bacterium]|nr:MAG: hypothetical protein E6K56_06935 [Ignavibacteria bacterium]